MHSNIIRFSYFGLYKRGEMIFLFRIKCRMKITCITKNEIQSRFLLDRKIIIRCKVDFENTISPKSPVRNISDCLNNSMFWFIRRILPSNSLRTCWTFFWFEYRRIRRVLLIYYEMITELRLNFCTTSHLRTFYITTLVAIIRNILFLSTYFKYFSWQMSEL